MRDPIRIDRFHASPVHASPVQASPVHASPIRVGYVLKQYPRLSETFILNEILGVERSGVDVTIFSLRHATEGRFHPAIASVRADVHYPSPVDRSGFLAAVRALPDLDTDRLGAVLDFVDRLPSERRARLLFHAIEVARGVRDHEVDHLHAHFLTVAAHTAHIVHLLTGVPYTVTAHAKDIYRHTVDWEVARVVADRAAAVVTVCDANLDFLTRRLGPTDTRLVRIYNGLGEQAPPAPLEDRQRGLVLGVGRLVEKKGFDVLLDAAARLARDRHDVECVIVGDGDQRAVLESRAARLGIADRTTFTGPLPQHEVATWLRRAHVLAAPCRVGEDGNQDALPTVLLEALGAGLPAVSTRVAGIPEIIGDGIEGLLVDDGADALADALATVMDDDERWRTMSVAGPRKLASDFDGAATTAELIGHFAPSEVLV